MTRPGWLSTSPHAALLESLRTIAWADGTLSPEERLMIVRLLGELGLVPSPTELHHWLDHAPGGDDVPEEPDPFSQRFLLSQAIRMAMEDGDYSGEERAQIEQWAAGWQISADELAELEAEIAKEPTDGFF